MRKIVLVGGVLLLFVLLNVLAAEPEAQVEITHLKSKKGNVVLSVFKDAESFDKEEPFKKLTYPKEAMVNGKLNVTLPLAPGSYGVTLIDDENGDGELQRSVVGIPKEGFGFSNYVLHKMAKPAFNEFQFDFSDPNTKIVIQAKYM